MVGLIATTTIWLVVIITQPHSRWAVIIWMVVGLVIYFLYLSSQEGHVLLTCEAEARPTIRAKDKDLTPRAIFKVVGITLEPLR